MPFGPLEDDISTSQHSYQVEVFADWAPEMGAYAWLTGYLRLNLGSEGSTSATVWDQADDRMQDLVNRLNAALAGTDWSIVATKHPNSYQSITAD